LLSLQIQKAPLQYKVLSPFPFIKSVIDNEEEKETTINIWLSRKKATQTTLEKTDIVMVLQTISETTRSKSLTTDTVSCLDLGREQDILLQSQAQKAALQVNCLPRKKDFSNVGWEL
jgi:hypothetical protein